MKLFLLKGQGAWADSEFSPRSIRGEQILPASLGYPGLQDGALAPSPSPPRPSPRPGPTPRMVVSGKVRASLEAERGPPSQSHGSPIRGGPRQSLAAGPISPGAKGEADEGRTRHDPREGDRWLGGQGTPSRGERQRRPQGKGRGHSGRIPALAPAARSPPGASGPLPSRPAPAVPHPPVTSASAAILGRRCRRRLHLHRHHLLLYLGARAASGPASAGGKSPSSASPTPGPRVSLRPVSP